MQRGIRDSSSSPSPPYFFRLKLKLNTLEEELELLKKQSLQALENERNRCNEEIGRMRNAFTEKLAEGHAREVSLSQELSNLEVRILLEST